MVRLKAYYNELCYRLLKWRWDKAINNSNVHGIVLMYHHVSNSYIPGELMSCQHSIKEFKSTILHLLKNGYKFLSIKDALDLVNEKCLEKFAVITFDDVPLDAYENAIPILKELQIPFTFFVTTSFLEKEGFVSKEQLVDLDRNCTLCTIGSHTITHPKLRRVSDSFEELIGSKRQLETMLGHSVDYLAYPYGRQSSVSNEVIQQAKEAGYKCAFSTIQSYISDVSIKNMYFLPRIVLK